MGDKTTIQWTDSTWNPVRGCSRVSPGCEHCYAERQAARFSGAGRPYEGLVRIGKQGPRWTGRVRLVPKHLADPIRWTRPRRIFVNSMSDLFHESLSDMEIAAVFGVMAIASRHTFQVLTKRARRAREWHAWAARNLDALRQAVQENTGMMGLRPWVWPLANVWLGVSVEDQDRADDRVPHLMQTPAAVRFVSYEPALGPVDFTRIRAWQDIAAPWHDALRPWWSRNPSDDDCAPDERGLDWIIVGGESGPGARPFDVAWARSVIEQCRAAGTACFVKQLGLKVLGDSDGFGLVRRWLLDGPDHEWVPPLLGPHAYTRPDNAVGFVLYDSHGGDWDEWPADLRVREFPDRRARARRSTAAPAEISS